MHGHTAGSCRAYVHLCTHAILCFTHALSAPHAHILCSYKIMRILGVKVTRLTNSRGADGPTHCQQAGSRACGSLSVLHAIGLLGAPLRGLQCMPISLTVPCRARMLCCAAPAVQALLSRSAALWLSCCAHATACPSAPPTASWAQWLALVSQGSSQHERAMRAR